MGIPACIPFRRPPGQPVNTAPSSAGVREDPRSGVCRSQCFACGATGDRPHACSRSSHHWNSSSLGGEVVSAVCPGPWLPQGPTVSRSWRQVLLMVVARSRASGRVGAPVSGVAATQGRRTAGRWPPGSRRCRTARPPRATRRAGTGSRSRPGHRLAPAGSRCSRSVSRSMWSAWNGTPTERPGRIASPSSPLRASVPADGAAAGDGSPPRRRGLAT